MDPLEGRDKQGAYHLLLNDDTDLSFREMDPGVLLFSPIRPCPSKKKEEFFIFLMRANFLGLGTGDSAIALDAEEKFLTLSTYLTYDMNFRSFKETVEDFVNFLDYWKGELERFEKEG